ncbi:MAG: InlB B-repeat-containing protein, partial [Clostridia bacterium]|nr:InlB B-repeat-containing protein [Clostridia bacterium]
MKIHKIIACLLCLSFVLGALGTTVVSAIAACEVSSMTAVYNPQTEMVNCTVKYSGTFLPNQNYVFVLTNANGAQLSLRTVSGTNLATVDNSFSYGFDLSADVVTSNAQPLKVTVRSIQPSVISTYTTDVVIIDKNPTVSFVGKDGTVLNTQTVEYGSAATAPEAPKIDGFDFVGWDKDFSAVTADMTVTAEYKAKEYNLTVTDGTGSGTYTYGTDAAIEFIPPLGAIWQFDGWTVTGDAVVADPTAENTTVTVYGNAIITANYTEVFMVSITGGKVAESDAKEYYKAGDVIEIIADTPAAGKEFAGWEIVSGGVITDASASTTTLIVNGNVIIESSYEDLLYNLNVVRGTGGGIYTYGTEVEIKFTPAAGFVWEFNGWTVTGDAVVADPAAEDTTITVYGNATVKANCTKLYTVTVNGGKVAESDAKEYYKAGDVIEIIADTPAAGKEFAGWETVSGGVITDASASTTTLIVNGNVIIESSYEDLLYNLNVVRGT